PYMYSIGGPFFPTGFFTGLAPGSYVVTVMDAAGCTATEVAVVGEGSGPELMLVEVLDATCGVNNGSIEVVGTGGTPTYTYSSDGVTYGASGLIPGLGAGTYTLYILDASGCGDTLVASVQANDAPDIEEILASPSTCGESKGSIIISAFGGLGILQYSMNGGMNFPPINVFVNLSSGTYNIVVQDEAGCEVTGMAAIQDLGGPEITSVSTTQACCGLDDGSIVLTAMGTAPLTYSIDCVNFGAANTFSGLPA